MSASVIASVALMAASAVAQSVGSAHVINKCTYDVTLCNVPAADGGYTQIDKTLQPNDSYEQQWTELSNSNGWSIKLSKDASLSNIMQYEYTFHDDGIIWYDVSDVNGNPWDGNWEITADSSTCTPKQQAYRYATDDAYGMQACAQDASITVTLCSGEKQDDGAASSASVSVATESATAASSYSAPASSIDGTSTTEAASSEYTSSAVASSTADATPTSTAVTPTTTFATSTTAVITGAPGGHTYTYVETHVVTKYATQTYWQDSPIRRDAERHAHHARHPHARR